MNNENKINWLLLVMFGLLSACLIYLVVVNRQVEYKDPGSPYSSPYSSESRGLKCAWNGAIYYDTVKNKIVEFTCE